MEDKEKDGIDSYNHSVWSNLGHPAFDNDYVLALDETLDWWDTGNE